MITVQDQPFVASSRYPPPGSVVINLGRVGSSSIFFAQMSHINAYVVTGGIETLIADQITALITTIQTDTANAITIDGGTIYLVIHLAGNSAVDQELASNDSWFDRGVVCLF